MKYLIALCSILIFLSPVGAAPIYGALQSTTEHIKELHDVGLQLATIEVYWDRYEPKEGQFNAGFIQETKRKMTALRKAGMQLVLDFGMQYPPAWVYELTGGKYQNQYGDLFAPPGAGMNGVNAVFSKAVRERQTRYARRVLSDLGTDFYAVRLGWGHYGELNYPLHKFNGHNNCYWGFDPIAQHGGPNLPAGIKPCPVPGWKPGEPSVDHQNATRFINWYLDSLKNYHDWQISTIRALYPGRLAMLYPSWGLRPGGIEGEVMMDLDGSTSPAINGEIQRGFDFARFIGGVKHPKLIVYCTWLDANGEDNGTNKQAWSPIHYLASLAQANTHHLAVWGENTGGNDYTSMQRCFEQMKRWKLIGMMWAFEGELFDGSHATLKQYKELIMQDF